MYLRCLGRGVILILLSIYSNVHGQHVVGVKFHSGTVYIHTPNVKNIEGAKPKGFEIDLSNMPTDSISFTKCNCFPRNGVTFSYFDFDKSFLGWGAMASYFIEPQYRITKDLRLLIRAAAGVAYTSKPFDAIGNPLNKSYVSFVNPYLQIGTGFMMTAGKHFTISLMGSLQHFSNGGFKEPNRGLNWLTGSAGILYYTAGNAVPKYKKVSLHIWKSKPIKTMAGVFIVPQQGYNSNIMGQRKFIGGMFLQSTKQYGRVSAFTGGAEMYFDKISYADGNERTYAIGGVQGGHAFLLGPVTFSQQIGYHLFNNNSKSDKVFLRFGLYYKVSKHLQTGVNLKTHSDNAEFTDLRIGYEF